MPAVQRTGQSGTGMAITIKTGVVYYTMLEYVKKNLSCIFPAQDHGKGCLCADEIYDTVQTMNISQTLNYSILLIIMEAFSLIVYLATDFTGRAASMLSFTMLLFLLFIAFNIVYCKYLLKQQRRMSQKELAEQSGVSQTTISHFEQGVSRTNPLRKQYYEKRDDSDKLKLDTVDED